MKHWWIVIVGISTLVFATNLTTFILTKQATVNKVVDNLTYFCYNNRNGAVIEGSNNVYILCRGVKIEEEPSQEVLDNLA